MVNILILYMIIPDQILTINYSDAAIRVLPLCRVRANTTPVRV
ncbi:hypothetical protein LCGC14_2092090 [marine sediment metagenome]|uniref:Uncharacterized protein n=1 Tax=marine sediment metagenome TaxID=412755 RepID=A0A0F9GQF9_9ZZZZ